MGISWKVISFAVFVVGLQLGASAEWIPKDPEEALFVYTRCAEEYLRQANNRATSLLKWMQWQMEPADEKATQCYIACMLTGLGLYDKSRSSFDSSVIKPQWEAYKTYEGYNQIKEADVDSFANAVRDIQASDNDCNSLFKAYKPVHEKHLTVSKQVFHGDPKLTKYVYDALKSSIKQKGQSYFDFCEKKFYGGSENQNILCQIRAYTVVSDRNFAEHTQCIFKGLRYLDENNEINVDEIARDFAEIKQSTNDVKQTLQSCKSTAGNNALAYYKCLVESPIKEKFKEAFDYREVRSRNYGYMLKASEPEYKKASVTSEVSQIDNGLGCK